MNSLNNQIDNLYSALMVKCESYALPEYAKKWYSEQLEYYTNPQDKLDALTSMLGDVYGLED